MYSVTLIVAFLGFLWTTDASTFQIIFMSKRKSRCSRQNAPPPTLSWRWRGRTTPPTLIAKTIANQNSNYLSLFLSIFLLHRWRLRLRDPPMIQNGFTDIQPSNKETVKKLHVKVNSPWERKVPKKYRNYFNLHFFQPNIHQTKNT